jgi:hypothetical protein
MGQTASDHCINIQHSKHQHRHSGPDFFIGLLAVELWPVWYTWRKYFGVSREVVYPNCRAIVLQPWASFTPALSGHQLQHIL